MRYHAYEMAHAMISPMRLAAKGLRFQTELPLNPLSQTVLGKSISAACHVFEGLTRRYGKPAWNIDATSINGRRVPLEIERVHFKPFCELIHFNRRLPAHKAYPDPKVLIVAPMSGHYATLLRGTVEAMLPEHDVYVTDWIDARQVPIFQGRFDLDDFIDYVIEFIELLGEDTHVMAVCQPAVPVLAAAAIMAARQSPFQPASMTLMGGPIDTRRNPTAVNQVAITHPIEWFQENVITTVPWPNAGATRYVYPGFIQLSGFVSMNLDRHSNAHWQLFENLVKGDCDTVAKHRRFYDEYLAVMDLTAEFYLQTIETVFQKQELPHRQMTFRGDPVDCAAIERTALLTVEGEKDDICGLGQTEAAHDLCTNIPREERFHYVQPGIGHYGVFNGKRWRTEIQPRIRDMIRTIEHKRGRIPQNPPVVRSATSMYASANIISV
ncbi:MAG: polyhydroxyalkanoate depolymerase [Pseudomonadota bacterium]